MIHADLVIALGVRFDDRVTGKLAEFCKNAKFIHIDIDPSEINKNISVDVPIQVNRKRISDRGSNRLMVGKRNSPCLISWTKKPSCLRA
jgi:acetolactate synthase-1/2/3 large subunit